MAGPGPQQNRREGEVRSLRIVTVDAETRDRMPGGRKVAGVSWVLWALLVASVLFLIGVRQYALREESSPPRSATATKPSAAGIITTTPHAPQRADQLMLSWEAVEGASHYLLRIHSLSQGMIVDRLRVHETSWMPNESLLAVLDPGDYIWQVEALDANAIMIARSTSASFAIAR